MSENGGDSQSRECRPIPVWGWILAAFLFPGGIFVGLAAARALRWWMAVLLALGSFGIFYVLVTIAESGQESCSPAAILAILWFYVAAGQFQYNIGCRHSLWTGGATRIWKGIGWITVAIAAVFSVIEYAYLCIQAAYGN
jgi:tetrahydromethanopterin S-methyltransferase subunit D